MTHSSDSEQNLNRQAEIQAVFDDAQLMAPVQEALDFSHSERTKEVAAQSPEAQIGQLIHQNPELFQSNLTPSIDNLDRTKSEVALPDPKGAGSTLYADRIDPETNHISEIKPNSEQ